MWMASSPVYALLHFKEERTHEKTTFARDAFALTAAPMLAAPPDNDKETDRLENSGMVMEEIMNIPDDIPQDLLDKAECVVVFPSVLKAAFIVGGSYGRGAMVCRSGEHFTGPGARPRWRRWRAEALDFNWAGRRPISSC